MSAHSWNRPGDIDKVDGETLCIVVCASHRLDHAI